MKKRIYGILLLAAVVIILLLTVQSLQGTVRLSEGLRLWLERFGFHSGFHSFRSNAHIILYFSLALFCVCMDGKEAGIGG